MFKLSNKTAFVLLLTFLFHYQRVFTQIEIPLFKRISYPFLPLPTSNAVLFSSDGLMWFSTSQGLVSFDGSGVAYYSDMKETNGFGLNNINVFAEDNQHNFYIGTRKGLFYYNRKLKSFSQITYFYKNNTQQAILNIQCCYIDRNGTVFAGSGNSGLFIYDPVLKKVQHFNLDSTKEDSWNNRNENTVISFLPHSKNASLLWVGTYNGIYLFNNTTKKFSKNFVIVNPESFFSGNMKKYYDAQQMIAVNDSTIFFNIYSGGLAIYNTTSGKAYIKIWQCKLNEAKKKINLIIPSCTKISNNYFLIGVKNISAALYDLKNNKLDFFKLSPGAKNFEEIQHIAKDTHDNIWVKCNGIWYEQLPDFCRLKTKQISRFSDEVNATELRGIYFDTSTSRYYGAVRFSTGIHVFDSNFNLIKIIPAPQFTNFYTDHQTCTDRITRDGSGRFWTTGWETYILPPNAKEFKRIAEIFPSLKWINKKGECDEVITTSNGDILLQESDNAKIYLINHLSMHTDTIAIPEFATATKNKIEGPLMCYSATNNVVYFSNSNSIAEYNFRDKMPRVIPLEPINVSSKSKQQILWFSYDDLGRLWLLEDDYGIRIIDNKNLRCVDSIPLGQRGLINDFYDRIQYGGKDCMFLQGRSGIVIYNYKKGNSILFNNDNELVYPYMPAILYANNHLIVGLRNQLQYYDTRLFNENNFTPPPTVNTITVDTSTVFTREYPQQNEITLKHNQNNITISFSAPEFIFPERLEYTYKLVGVNKDWQHAGYFNRRVTYNNLSPGKYQFQLKAQMQGGNWNNTPGNYIIIIQPAWWQTNLFHISCIISACLFAFLLIRWRLNAVRNHEQQKARTEKEMLQLEAKALRAQMNPHFIFNSMNSIKALIQENEDAKAIGYLTTFSKLIRSLFQNSDKREVSFFDEIETCLLYVQLESMRFGRKFNYNFYVDETLDLKSLQVPALIIQPFIENAIWHGIMPKEDGGCLNVTVERKNGNICCIIDDDGIGRELSRQNKFKGTASIHESKGMRLTQNRLDLHNALNESNASLEIIDKKDEDGKAIGTKIVLLFKEY